MDFIEFLSRAPFKEHLRTFTGRSQVGPARWLCLEWNRLEIGAGFAMIRCTTTEFVKSSGNRQSATTRRSGSRALRRSRCGARGVAQCRTTRSSVDIGHRRENVGRTATFALRHRNMTSLFLPACEFFAPINFFGGPRDSQSLLSQGPSGVALPIGPWEFRCRRFHHCTSFHTGSC